MINAHVIDLNYKQRSDQKTKLYTMAIAAMHRTVEKITMPVLVGELRGKEEPRVTGTRTRTFGNIDQIKEALGRGEGVVILVFGKKLQKDGTLGSRGIATVSKVYELYKELETKISDKTEMPIVLLTGGKSSSYVFRGVEVPSEAQTMKNELEKRGSGSMKILLEENSFDTIGNIILSYPTIKGLGAKKVVLIAEEPMMDRTMKIAKRVFGESFEILAEPASVELSGAYRLYNRAKEWIAYKVLFERNFKDIEAGNIGAFTEKNGKRKLYNQTS